MVKNPLANVGDVRDVGSVSGLGSFPGGGHSNSSTLAWRIPWMEEPGGLQSIGSQRARHDWVTLHTCTGNRRWENSSRRVKLQGIPTLLALPSSLLLGQCSFSISAALSINPNTTEGARGVHEDCASHLGWAPRRLHWAESVEGGLLPGLSHLLCDSRENIKKILEDSAPPQQMFLQIPVWLAWNYRSSVAWTTRGFLGDSAGKECRTQETQVWSLGWDDPLEKEMVTHSSILIWEIPWTEEPGRLQPMGLQKSDMTECADTQACTQVTSRLDHNAFRFVTCFVAHLRHS